MMGIPLILLSTLAALSGIYFGLQMATKTQPPDQEVAGAEQVLASPRYAVPEIFVYPMQNENGLADYLVVRVAVSLAKNASEVSIPADDVLLADAFYSTIFAMRSRIAGFDSLPAPESMADALIEQANSGSGLKRFERAFLQQFDVFEPDGMRRKNVRERNIEPAPAEAEKPAKKSAPDGH